MLVVNVDCTALFTVRRVCAIVLFKIPADSPIVSTTLALKKMQRKCMIDVEERCLGEITMLLPALRKLVEKNEHLKNKVNSTYLSCVR
jgi:hypothetical protein